MPQCYSNGIDIGLKAGIGDASKDWSMTEDGARLATLYCNRAQTALKLGFYEQVRAPGRLGY